MQESDTIGCEVHTFLGELRHWYRVLPSVSKVYEGWSCVSRWRKNQG